MPFEQFDRSKLKLLPLAERVHDLDISVMMDTSEPPAFEHPTIELLADRVAAAKQKGATVLVMMGAHVLRAGNAPWLIELMEKGAVSHFALNGAGAIHDFEFAEIGATTESVARYISEGQFGLWQEDALFNDALAAGVADGLGFGESIGRYIEQQEFPYRKYSLFAAGYRNQVPVTAHVGIGADIVHEQPNCDGAVTGQASYTDFLIYAQSITKLEGGVFINIGSAVTGPEVYLKSLSMARNVARQNGGQIAHFTTAVFDMHDIEGSDFSATPPKTDARYYFRPWKTILARTVADGGEGYYVSGDHKDTVPALANAILKRI